MLKRWLSEGVLADPACEFMVVKLSNKRPRSTNTLAVSFRTSVSRESEDVWRSLFDKAPAPMIPSFFSADMVNKVRRALRLHPRWHVPSHVN